MGAADAMKLTSKRLVETHAANVIILTRVKTSRPSGVNDFCLFGRILISNVMSGQTERLFWCRIGLDRVFSRFLWCLCAGTYSIYVFWSYTPKRVSQRRNRDSS